MRIDAHHHLWDLSRREQPWMDGPWADPIRRGYALSDLTPHLAEHGIDGTVLVQSSSSYEETAELLALAAGEGPVAGVVGWADLRDPALAEVLAALPAGLVGIRHQVQDEPDPDWLTRPDVLRGLGALAGAGLVYDLLVTPRELPAAHTAVRALPQLAFVLDHAGKPPVVTGEWQPWADAVTALAALPNVSCKLSGLVTEADREAWRPQQILPYARHVLDAFGPGRVMFGSDWPVCTLAAGYEDVVALAEAATGQLAATERSDVFGATAGRVYGIGTPPAPDLPGR
ncbi:L-fuconolactonase [Streptomyces sp. SceaMP-e96]|uniref:amidohydrolase family protein n=1 Tax=unclassified Streptomyces TaxID=2593676 RepID=UPI000823E71C|nr:MULTISPECIES: amidohydrolase family protein [unclassified Streptomyces]MYT13865.1 amidohydrolase family protein [Streptomyces sp. SID4951]SCK55996.1 L-fuconolactonase [Streptomyces sp. SceaMP-e96]